MPIISHFKDIFSNTPNTFGPNCQISVLDAGSRLLSLPVVTVNCSCPSIALDEILSFYPLVALSQIS